ncbi:Late transcription factor VLTF-4 (1), partial [Monkeypox virus]
ARSDLSDLKVATDN